MEYRRLDYTKDVKEVVTLIKGNLNPDYSEEVLKWKHLESPFGESMGLIAVQDENIVGVLFASLYKFQNNSAEKIISIRFFDACTQPDNRGKGIFKTLMSMAFEAYRNKFDFSFSNPNPASLKGHLRVGYNEPLNHYFYRLGIIQPYNREKVGVIRSFTPKNINDNPLAKQDLFLAGNSLRFIKWRYREKRYKVLVHCENEQIDYFIYRIEEKKRVKAIVICDFFGDANNLSKIIKAVCKREKTLLVYYLENQITKNIKFLFTRKYKKAVVVYKNEIGEIPNNFVISLGDLEGRL